MEKYELIPGILAIGKSILIKKEKVMIIGDIHIGYEESLNNSGIFVPRNNFKEIFSEIQYLINRIKPKIVVINGDLKHEMGKISNQEWKEISELLNFLKSKAKIILIKGNHDKIIEPIAKKQRIKFLREYKTKFVCITHGDSFIESDKKVIIIGHEHPAITLRENFKRESFKVFLKGKIKNKTLIVMPSFFNITEGNDFLNGEILSPYIKKGKEFEVFVIGDKIYNFGKIKDFF